MREICKQNSVSDIYDRIKSSIHMENVSRACSSPKLEAVKIFKT